MSESDRRLRSHPSTRLTGPAAHLDPPGHRLLLLICFCVAVGCASPDADTLRPDHRRALADTVATLFDSLSTIHRDQPDTGLLRRLHPPDDSILFIEGSKSELFSGDSLFRRVLAAHGPVRTMSQRFSRRISQILDGDNALLTATEDVDWVDSAGAHTYSGLLTIAVSRRGRGWVIRAYRGS